MRFSTKGRQGASDNAPATSDRAAGSDREAGQSESGAPRRRAAQGRTAGYGFAGRGAALFGALLAAVCCGSCITPRLSVAADTDPAAWREPAEVTVRNDDTLARHNLDLFLRCNDRFGEDTLTVHITVLTPDSLRFEEPFLLTLPRDRRPAALASEAVIPYRRCVRFGRTGDYRIRITPARPVRGVEAVGIHIVNE